MPAYLEVKLLLLTAVKDFNDVFTCIFVFVNILLAFILHIVITCILMEVRALKSLKLVNEFS